MDFRRPTYREGCSKQNGWINPELGMICLGLVMFGALLWGMVANVQPTLAFSQPPSSPSIPSAKTTSAVDCGAVTAIPEKECEALVTFYQETNGTNWISSTKWLDDEIPCGWYGVVCVAGHVTELNLATNGLAGELPTDLADLRGLRKVELEANQLAGQIPSDLSNLTALQSLFLFDNQLSGEIPPQLGNMKDLVVLSLAGNELTGTIPSELANLTNLMFLSLSNNQLTGEIPSDLSRLTNLNGLFLAGNQLTGTIPLSLTSLISLTGLSLSDNQLVGPIPSELGELVNLQGLWLAENQLEGNLPDALGNLSDLLILSVANNPLVWPIPESFLDLGLLEFSYGATKICIPEDERFDPWLDGINALPFRGEPCPKVIYLPVLR